MAGLEANLTAMRLPVSYADFFKSEIGALRPDATVHLFGSRTDDARRGGDVDIPMLCDPVLNWEETARIRRRFWERFGFQKLDLISFRADDRSAFKELVMLDAVRV